MKKWQFYFQEAQHQIHFAKRSYVSFQQALVQGIVMDVFWHLHHFLVHAANIDRLLDVKQGTERHMIISGHFDLSDVDLKPFRRLRNHLEHFDERLDRWVREYDGHAFFEMNIVTGTQGFPRKAFLRALDSNVFKFYGEDYDMAELHASILEIEHRLSDACD